MKLDLVSGMTYKVHVYVVFMTVCVQTLGEDARTCSRSKPLDVHMQSFNHLFANKVSHQTYHQVNRQEKPFWI